MSRKQKQGRAKTSPIIDVVITTGGRYDMLRKCLDALYQEAESVSLGIYIIDNASHPDDRRMNEDVFSMREGSRVADFRTKRLTQEVGFPAANNEAARVGNAPLILFLNDDVELHEGSIKKIVDTFKDETIGIVGAKLIFPPNSGSIGRPAGKVQHVGMAFSIRGDIFHPLIGWSPDNPRTCLSRDVISVTGACLAIRRVVFSKLGGFSLDYGLGTWEDVDLCFRVRAGGLRIYMNADATGYHYAGATQEKKNRGYPLQQNQLIFQAKWAATGMMAWTEPDFW